MLSGRKALSQIDQSLQTVRNETVRLDHQLTSLSGQFSAGEQRRLAILKQIAKVRLSEIESGALQASFSEADDTVRGLLAQRDSAFDELNERITNKNEEIVRAEQVRDEQLANYNSESQQLLDIEAKVQAELRLNVAYLAQLKKAQQAESVAEEAEQKVAIAVEDFKEKAKPYQADPLFMYLWQRGFGTTEYAAGLFSRFIDGWVARLIKYEPARINFWNLNEIPKRLGEHAERVGALSDVAFDALQAIESGALSQAGANDVERSMQDLRTALDELDDQIETQENDLNDLLDSRSEFNAGEDSYFEQCLSKIAEALAHQSMHSINRYVLETQSSEDDRLIYELQTLETSLATLKNDMSSVRNLHNAQINKLRELEGVRHQFKNSRFDDVRSGFVNEGLVSSVLNQFLQGLISGADLWGTIKRHQRYREHQVAPDFGSGGIGDLIDVVDAINRSGVDLGDILMPRAPKRRKRRRSKGSTWHIPKPRRSGGGFQMPRTRSRSSGGFKTGGGF